MPAMVAFGRRWGVGTDDFLFVGLIDAVLFLPLLIFIGLEIYYWFYSYRISCNAPLLTDIFLISFFCSLFINLLLAVSFIHFSSKGAILQTDARKHVVLLFYFKAVICAVDIALTCLGTFMLYEDDFCNTSKIIFAVKVGTIFLWVATVARIIYVIIIYDTAGSQKLYRKQESICGEPSSVTLTSKSIQKWKFRFHALFASCAAFSNAKKDAISTASEIFAIACQPLDLVPSDVVAGMMLFQKKCLKKYQSEVLSLDSAPMITQTNGTELDCFPTTDMESWMNLHLAERYFHIGLGVFGWPWVFFRNLSCGFCSLWSKLKCCFWCRRDSFVEGDNCCGCNTASLQVTGDVPYEDLVHVSFVNSVYTIPFFVCIDPQTSAVIITIRGTMSFTDVMTDLAAGVSPIISTDGPPDIFCHSGILKAAKKIQAKLEDGILSTAFSGRENYNLVTTGHSLGGGIACVLALLFRPTFPSVRCYAFAPPPIISAGGLSGTFSCVFTVIFGNDVVPYISFRNILCVSREILQCLKECNLPKYKIFCGCTPESQDSNCLPCNSSENKVPHSDDNCLSGESPENSVLDSNESKLSSVEVSGDMNLNSIDYTQVEINENEEDEGEAKFENETKVLQNQPQNTDLYVPGKILHIRKSEKGFKLHIATAQEYHPLVLRPQICAHHFPQHMEKCLKQLGETYTILSLTP